MPNCASVETSLLTLDRYSENREPRKSWQSVLWNHPLRSPICLLPANICVCVPAVGHSAKLYNLDSVPWTLAFLFQLFFPIFLRTENHRVWGYEDCWRFGAIGRRTCGKTAVSHLMNSGSNNIPHMGQIDGDGCLDSDYPECTSSQGPITYFRTGKEWDGKVGRNSGGLPWWRCLTLVAGSTRASLSQEHPFRHKKHPLPSTIIRLSPSPCIVPSIPIVCCILPIIITIIFASA